MIKSLYPQIENCEWCEIKCSFNDIDIDFAEEMLGMGFEIILRPNRVAYFYSDLNSIATLVMRSVIFSLDEYDADYVVQYKFGSEKKLIESIKVEIEKEKTIKQIIEDCFSWIQLNEHEQKEMVRVNNDSYDSFRF